MAIDGTKAVRTRLDANSACRIQSCSRDQGFARRAAAAVRRNQQAAQQQQVQQIQNLVQQVQNQAGQIDVQAQYSQQQIQQREEVRQSEEHQQARDAHQAEQVDQHQQPDNQGPAESEVDNVAIHRWLQQCPVQEPWNFQGRSSQPVASPELTTRARASSSTRATRRSSDGGPGVSQADQVHTANQA
ncbi:hypothetical protein DL546_006074 [Coniochaeta pulveracea]|uniref:Uncharacterized protein n=1 Tax=Coniochaeta pulveracea TaxID=177199 RepID=A0A420YBN1_9PEZI|nr:hypothetical protein DL546_006074 [Coniochaeta pulveracea]